VIHSVALLKCSVQGENVLEAIGIDIQRPTPVVVSPRFHAFGSSTGCCPLLPPSVFHKYLQCRTMSDQGDGVRILSLAKIQNAFEMNSMQMGL